MGRKYVAYYPGIRPITDEEAGEYYRKGHWRLESLHDEIRRHVAARGDDILFDDGTISLTWREFDRMASRLALHLVELGIKPGEIIGIQCPNWVEMPILFSAVERIGCSILPCGDHFQEREMEHAFRITQSRAVLTPSKYRDYDSEEMYRNIRKRIGQPSIMIGIRSKSYPEGWIPYGELMDDHIEERKDPEALLGMESGTDDPMLVQLTSGTTALPKVNMRSINTLRYIVHDQYKTCARLREGDVTVTLAPIAGGTGLGYGVVAPLLGGFTSYLLERFDATEALRLIKEKEATVAVAVPAMMIKMLEILEKESFEFPKFRVFCNSGAPLPAQIAERIEKLMGCTIFTVYGTSDGGVPVTSRVWDPPEKRYVSAGRLLKGMACRLTNDKDEEVPVGEIGEFVWRDPNSGLGYLRNSPLTEEYWKGSPWYHSGDLGRVDEEGYYYVVGRKGDMILRGGQNISPREIEDHLIDHPKVRNAAAVGMPDPVLGERVCVYVIPEEDCIVTKEELVEFLSGRKIAKYNYPERVEMVSELPLSRDQKVIKSKLVKDITAKLKEEGVL